MTTHLVLVCGFVTERDAPHSVAAGFQVSSWIRVPMSLMLTLVILNQ